jgi:hypothetical protein
MGYKPGQGLGRRNQGLVNPIEARVMPKGKSLFLSSILQYFIQIGRSLDAVLELKKKNKLPDAFKIKKHRQKSTNTKQKKLPEQKDFFTFLDKVFTSEMRSSLFSINSLINKLCFSFS